MYAAEENSNLMLCYNKPIINFTVELDCRQINGTSEALDYVKHTHKMLKSCGVRYLLRHR